MARPGATFTNYADGHPVGAMVSSMLTLAQFQAAHGTGWVLADGSTATGTKYGTLYGFANLPDLRGQVLRGKNNGRVDGNQNPDGDVALGTFQDHQVVTHNHGLSGSADGSTLNQYVAQPYRLPSQAGFTTPAAGSTVGGNETRMRNVTVNHFIKVN